MEECVIDIVEALMKPLLQIGSMYNYGCVAMIMRVLLINHLPFTIPLTIRHWGCFSDSAEALPNPSHSPGHWLLIQVSISKPSKLFLIIHNNLAKECPGCIGLGQKHSNSTDQRMIISLLESLHWNQFINALSKAIFAQIRYIYGVIYIATWPPGSKAY